MSDLSCRWCGQPGRLNSQTNHERQLTHYNCGTSSSRQLYGEVWVKKWSRTGTCRRLEIRRLRAERDRLRASLYRIVNSKSSLKETDGAFVVRLRAMVSEAVNYQPTYRCPACGSPSQAVADKVAECLSCGRFSVAAEAAGGEK